MTRSGIARVTILLLTLTSAPRSSASEGTTLATRAGTLTVDSEMDALLYGVHKVKLGHTTVFEAYGKSVTLYATYPFGAKDVVLVGVVGGGVTSEHQQLTLLVLEPGMKPHTISDDR